MESPPAYKKINTISKLLEHMWSLFPNIIAVKNGAPMFSLTAEVDKKIYNSVMFNSVEFCDLLSKNILKIQPFAKGAFGEVGSLTIDEDSEKQPLKAIILSFKKSGGFEPFYTDVIIKLYLSGQRPTWAYENEIFFISDPLSEMIFGSMVGHLYDLGICPFFTKYFGAYLCIDNKTSIVTEASTIELRQLISRQKNGIAQKYPSVIINLLFQYVYALFIMKMYYGLVHFDTHHRNIMATFIHNRYLPLMNPKEDYIYQGENLSQKQFIMIQTHLMSDNPYINARKGNLPVFICIRNTGLLLKLIDYGLCVSYLNKSMAKEYKNDIVISSMKPELKRIGALKAYEETKDPSILNTTEIMYTLTNIWEHMSKGLDKNTGAVTPDSDAPEDFKEALRMVNEFSKLFFGEEYELSSFLRANPQRQVQYVKLKEGGMGLAWVSFEHNAGIKKESFNTPYRLLEGLLNVCNKQTLYSRIDLYQIREKEGLVFYFEPEISLLHQNYGSVFNNENTMLLVAAPTERITNWNLFSKYISSVNLYRANDCYGKSTVLCDNIQKDINKYSLDSLATKWLYRPSSKFKLSLDSIPLLTDTESNLVFSNLPRENLQESTNIFNYFQIEIHPEALNLHRNAKGALVYQKYQSWLDFKDISDEKVGKYVETVFLHIFKLKGGISNIHLDKQLSLWEGALEHFPINVSGLAVNGGYFIIPGNINYLNPKLSNRQFFEPIGFFYDSSFKDNGTYLSYPSVYEDDLAVIFGTKKTMNLYRYKDFLNLHRQVEDTISYEVKINGQFTAFREKIPAIAMKSFYGVDPSLIGTRPFKSDGSEVTDNDYSWAFTSGPILIWDGKVVFTEQKMNSELIERTIDGKNVLAAAVPYAKNSYKFRSAEFEGNQFYGMRHSHRYMVHNILAVNKKHQPLIIFCEGRGFDSPGLDRVQLANLISIFNIQAAVSLDGGFSANAVYKNCHSTCRPMFALNDPDKRRLGISLYFS